MSKKSVSIYDLVSRIERAPNMSRVIDAYDAALGGSDVSAHRYRGQWQVWHGQGSGFCGDFSQVRAHLAEKAEELLEHASEAEAAAQVALKPAMVEQPCQQQQARATGPVIERSFAMAEWQDDSKSSPLYALMREMADDTAPHLNGLPESHPEVQALRTECMAALKTGRRAAGGRQGSQTRAANVKKGISQRGLKGSTRQKQWAAEIRGTMQRAAGDDAGFADLVEEAQQAKFWIDNRKLPWSDLAVRFKRAKERNDAAVEEVRSILIGSSIVSPEQSRRCDELVKIQREFSRFLRR